MRLDRAPGKVLCKTGAPSGCGMGITVTAALVVMGRVSLCSRVDRLVNQPPLHKFPSRK